MHKRTFDPQLFLLGILLSLSFFSLAAGLLYVNASARRTGMTDDRAFVEWKGTPEQLSVRVADGTLTIDRTALRRAEPMLQKLTVFLPGPVRALAAGLRGLTDTLEGAMFPFPSAQAAEDG